MANEDLIREIAVRVCIEVLREKSRELAEDVAGRMGAALASQPQRRDHVKELRDGAVLIAGSRTQTEILEALLTASSAITPSCGLMILRGEQANGWSCIGLTALDNFKRATMDCTRGVVAKVIRSSTADTAKVSELDPVFVARLGLASDAKVLLVPVLLKGRVAALLVALSQQADGLVGLELLTQVARLSLDLLAYRKVPQQRAVEAEQRHHASAPEPAPVAAAQTGVTALAPPVETPEPPPVAPAPTEIAPRAVPMAIVASTAIRESVMPPQVPVLDEAHEKARRFAKLLVEEIKLYNQSKVNEGRARGDLYSRLREDIEKSRAAYQNRYGESISGVDYFTQELLRILADNNRAVMGLGFPG